MASRYCKLRGAAQGCQALLDNYAFKDYLTTGAEDRPMKLVPKRRLRCSFCGKSERDVAKLLAGPKVHICDACIGVCNRILEATPATSGGWDVVSDERLLAALKPAAASVDATRAVLQSQVGTLRRRGVSWDAIGRALGTSRQAAWERFS
jgi:hypothetical protein